MQSIALLLLLYFLQGIPFGLSGTLDLTMQEGGRLSYEEQGIYSSVSWPYSLKMLWAPLVDSLFLKRFGRRKTWLIPAQLLIAIILLGSAEYIPELMGEPTNSTEPTKPRVYELTLLFFTFFFLCATQDIAVDGWALEMLSKQNVAWASTCNSIGLTAGYTASFQGFMALKSFGLVDFPQFMRVSGWAYLITTIGVALFKKEYSMEEAPSSISSAYVQTWQVCKLDSVKVLLGALITRSVGFAASDTLTTRKLLEMGLKKETVATIAALLLPVSLILPGVLARYTTKRPLHIFSMAYIPRLLLAFVSMFAVFYFPTNLATLEHPPLWCWLILLVLSVAATVLSNCQFVPLMAFFAKVSDPMVGGSYMTTLNTATNLGSKWPNTLVLFAVNPLTIPGVVDGYYVLNSICIALGCLWYYMFYEKLEKLESLDESAWRVPREKDQEAVE